MGSAVRLKFLFLFFSFSSICVLRKENVFPIKWGRWREDRETQYLTRIESEGHWKSVPYSRDGEAPVLAATGQILSLPSNFFRENMDLWKLDTSRAAVCLAYVNILLISWGSFTLHSI